MPTGAESLVAALASVGVERIWGVVGDALNPFVDALEAEEEISWNATRHRAVEELVAKCPHPPLGERVGLGAHGGIRIAVIPDPANTATKAR